MYSYSPFSDENGNRKDIYSIVYNDLSQLAEKEIKEGFQVEYKSMLSDSVFKRLPRIICSFANERGGWLFIGIKEDTLLPCPIPKQEFELKINTKLNYECSPVPDIVVKLLPTPENPDEGVLIIWIPEGRNPPYICNGTIYQRVGSGSSPVKEVNDRFFVDKLYQKAGEHREAVEKFCTKTVTVYNREWVISKYTEYGMCNIYIMPLFQADLLESKPNEEVAAYFEEQSLIIRNLSIAENYSFGMNMPFYRSNYSIGAILFRNSQKLDHFQSTTVWEQRWTGAAKFHIPIPYFSKQYAIKKISPFVKNVDDPKILEEFCFVNGNAFINSILGCYVTYFYAMKNLFERLEDYIIVIDLENVRKDVLIFDTDFFYKYVEANGLPFSDKNDHRINESFMSNKVSLEFFPLITGAMSVVIAFGMDPKIGIAANAEVNARR